MKKFFAVLLLMFCLLTPALFTQKPAGAVTEGDCRVVATQCNLFVQPNFDEKVVDEAGEPVILKHNDIVTVTGEEGDFAKVNFKQYQGYVVKFLITSNLDEQTIYPVFNAEVVAEQAEVFDVEDQPANFSIKKGTKLYLYDGFKKSRDKTPVCFVLEDGSLFYGYLWTKDLQPYGINAWVITGIVVAASCVTIILLLVFMKKKKVAKNK